MLADGATSRMAMQMGYCTEPPKGVCSRAYVEGGTHNADFDGAIYRSKGLWGADAIVRRACTSSMRIAQKESEEAAANERMLWQ